MDSELRATLSLLQFIRGFSNLRKLESFNAINGRPLTVTISTHASIISFMFNDNCTLLTIGLNSF